MLRKSLEAEPMDGDEEDMGEGEGEHYEEIDPIVEIIEETT